MNNLQTDWFLLPLTTLGQEMKFFYRAPNSTRGKQAH